MIFWVLLFFITEHCDTVLQQQVSKNNYSLLIKSLLLYVLLINF